MTTIRVMTYNVQRCCGADGRFDPDRILRVIAEGAPDVVALQEIPGEEEPLRHLAERLGMERYGAARPGGNAFLSYYPLRAVQEYELGSGGVCLRADADVHGKRIHLFNLRLDSAPSYRRRQISSLLGPELLSNPALGCPLLVMGDFGDLFWGAGNMSLTLVLRKAGRSFCRFTYPASFPLVARDRAYLRGEIRIVDSSVVRSHLARQASSHLPFVMTVQVRDPRTYLRVEQQVRRGSMEIAPG